MGVPHFSKASMSTRAWPCRRASSRVATRGTSAICGPNTRNTAAHTALPCRQAPDRLTHRTGTAVCMPDSAVLYSSCAYSTDISRVWCARHAVALLEDSSPP